MPLQVPTKYLEKFSFIDDKNRQAMRAMASYLDDEIGLVVQQLKDSGLWANTLVVFHADNGGEIMTQFCGSNNYPLRGGKFSNFEGGIRVNGLVSGGFLPEGRRGEKENGLIEGADWLATYAAIAGVEGPVTDERAVRAGLPDYDSINQWGVISGEQGATGREEVVIGDTTAIEFNGDGGTLVAGVISSEGYKILLGAENKREMISQDVITGPEYPNSSAPLIYIPELIMKKCGRTPEDGCLYNVFADESESVNLASNNPDLFYKMLARVAVLQETVYSPDRGKKTHKACHVAMKENGGFWGPFL